MKVRQGFVSNSSSASFVAIGVKLNTIDEIIETAQRYGFEPTADSEKWDAVDYLDNSLPEGMETISLDGDGTIFGKILAKGSSDEYYLADAEFSITDLYEFSKDVAAKLEVPLETVKVYLGEFSC